MYARMFAQRMMALVASIPRFPLAGRRVPEYGREDVREKLCGDYRLVYRLKDDAIEIVAITHGAKPLKPLV